MQIRGTLFPGLFAAFTLGAVVQAQADECNCGTVVLNGSLNTADFSGGVGYGAGYGGAESAGYTYTIPSAPLFAMGRPRIFPFGNIHFGNVHPFPFAHGMSGHGGMHVGFGGGHH